MDLTMIPSWASRMLENGSIDEAALEKAATDAEASGQALEQALLAVGGVREETIAIHVALDLGVPYIDPRQYDIRLSNRSLVPEALARRYRLFPLFFVGGTMTLGMNDPTDLAVIDQVRLRSNHQVETCFSPPTALDALIERAYSGADIDGAEDSATPTPADMERDTLVDTVGRTSNKIVRRVRTMVEEAVRDGASDVHIEPESDKLRIRIRVDGVLHEQSVFPVDDHAPMVSRIKVKAKMDIAETRRPQDGHFSTSVNDRTVDVRVSTLPTVYGENVVLRLLLSDSRAMGLEEIGLPEIALDRFKTLLETPHGLILATGPTGSGKTTTLYAALSRINTVERNIVTVEDPVEKRLPLLRQTQVNPKAGVTFAAGLRSILRQDPDVIMVGEIRDRETAEIAVQAALTGHLVMSTLHTNTAAGAVVRLSEMGIAPFLITSSLQAVISQRLARQICPACREPVEPDRELLTGLGFAPEATDFFRGTGCARCLQSGYKGRIGIYEMLQITPALSRALLSDASRDQIEKEAEAALICNLLEEGRKKVLEGLTTVEELTRIAGVRSADPEEPLASTNDGPEEES